jgi:hypothetical protein
MQLQALLRRHQRHSGASHVVCITFSWSNTVSVTPCAAMHASRFTKTKRLLQSRNIFSSPAASPNVDASMHIIHEQT